MNRMKSALLSIIIAMMALVSCKTDTISPQLTITPQTFATMSLTTSPSLSATASSTPQVGYPRSPVPTISFATQLKIGELLYAKNCIMPCYLGINPGVTTWIDAKNILDSVGAADMGQTQEGEITWFGYAMHSGSTNNTLGQQGGSDTAKPSFFDLNLAVDRKGIVQQLFAFFLTHDAGHIFSEYWAKNSPRNIFLQLGVPDFIYSTISGGDLALVYQQRGIVAIYDSFWSEEKICPGNEDQLSIMHFMLTNTEFPLDIYPPSENVTQEPWLWLPIEQTLHVSVQQFYEKVTSDSSACFELNP